MVIEPLTLTDRIWKELFQSPTPLCAKELHELFNAKGYSHTKRRINCRCREMVEQGRLRRANRFDPVSHTMRAGFEPIVRSPFEKSYREILLGIPCY